MKVLLTGSTGFLGVALARAVFERRVGTLRLALRPGQQTPAGLQAQVTALADLAGDLDWHALVGDCDAVIHAAGRAHVAAADPDDLFLHVNTRPTLALAQAAAEAGVRRFVFISSVKVHGESTPEGQAFTEDSPLRPLDAYGRSKARAEEGLWKIAQATRMQVSIVRPPLMYGPGVRANFRALVRAVNSGLPLPLGAIRNRRSLLALDNAVDLVLTCLQHPAAAQQAFLGSDGHDLSTAELVREIATALGRPARLLPCPPAWLGAVAALAGKKAMAQRLCENLQVDITKARRILGWQPPLSIAEAMRRAVEQGTPR